MHLVVQDQVCVWRIFVCVCFLGEPVSIEVAPLWPFLVLDATAADIHVVGGGERGKGVTHERGRRWEWVAKGFFLLILT